MWSLPILGAGMTKAFDREVFSAGVLTGSPATRQRQTAAEAGNETNEIAALQVKIGKYNLFNTILRNSTYKIRNKPLTKTGYYRKQEHFVVTLAQ